MSAGFSIYGDGKGIKEQGLAMKDAINDHDGTGVKNAFLEGISNVASLVDNGATVLTAAGIIKEIPGLNIASASFATIASANKAVEAHSRVKAAQGNEATIADIKKARGDDDKVAKWVDGLNRHASKVAEIERDAAIVETVTGAVNIVAGSLDVGGVTAIAGASVGLCASAGDFVNAQVVMQRQKTAMADRVNEVTGLDTRMQKLMAETPGLTRSDAKHTILQECGYKSGKRSEVFLNIAKHDAELIVAMDADKGNAANKKISGMLKDSLGLAENKVATKEDVLKAMGVDEDAAKDIEGAIAEKRGKERTSDLFKYDKSDREISIEKLAEEQAAKDAKKAKKQQQQQAKPVTKPDKKLAKQPGIK
jgi:hypothetical protein